jgi:hypothetical protein
VKGTTTDDSGNFTLENLTHGSYILHFSFIGFTYNFGNSKLQDNNRTSTTKESDRLN